MLNLFPSDTYIVKNNTVINNEDRKLLIMLYQPVIGSIPISMYFTLWSNLDNTKIVSTEYNHHNLMAILRITLDEILEAREKLEAIGLIKTYLKKGEINNYIYELYSPITADEFLNNPILYSSLVNNIGKRETNKIIKYFSKPNIDIKDYENITSNFNDVFEMTNTMGEKLDVRKPHSIDLIVNANIKLNDIFSLIPDEMLNKKAITNETKKLIYNLSFTYGLKNDDLVELIRNSINELHQIDNKILRKNTSNYYSFENGGKIPSLIYKKQPENLRKQTTLTTNKAKMIYLFENTTPYDFLCGKNKGVSPSKNDLKLVEQLLVEYELTPGVVNVLIDYILKINNNKLIKNFALAIASQWKRSNIVTVEEAMNFSKKENVKQKPKNTKIKKEVKPDWFNKNIEENKASEEEIKKLEEMLNR